MIILNINEWSYVLYISLLQRNSFVSILDDNSILKVSYFSRESIVLLKLAAKMNKKCLRYVKDSKGIIIINYLIQLIKINNGK